VLDKIRDYAEQHQLSYEAILEQLVVGCINPGRLDESLQAARRQLRQQALDAERVEKEVAFPP
jgi:hypothetical protein